MAVMTPYQQRLLMQQLARRDPTAIARLAGAQGGGLAGLVGGPQGGDMSLLGLVEPPQLMTPGSPAPMQPGREVVAPPPPQQQQAEQVAPVGPGYRKDGAVDQAVMTPEALQGLASARSAEIEDRIRAAAVVSPKMAEMLAGREERYSKELTDIEEDQKRTGWEALAMAGMRMAQSQSPYFMSALATGLEAGLTGYSAKKAAAAERKARLQEQKENVELYREQLKTQAEDREAARVAREMGMTKDQLGITDASVRTALGLETYGPAVEVAKMEPEAKRAAIANVISETDLRYRTDPNAGRGGEGRMFPPGYPTLRNSLTSQISDAQRILGNISTSREAKAAASAQIAQLNAQLQALDAQGGVLPTGSPLGGARSFTVNPIPQGAPQASAAPAKAPAPSAQAPAPRAQAPAPAPTPAQQEAAVREAIRKANAERKQYEGLPRGTTGLIRLAGERGDVRRSVADAVNAAKSSGLPQYRRRTGETNPQYDRRIRQMLNLPSID